jgi:hypothetical protein
VSTSLFLLQFRYTDHLVSTIILEFCILAQIYVNRRSLRRVSGRMFKLLKTQHNYIVLLTWKIKEMVNFELPERIIIEWETKVNILTIWEHIGVPKRWVLSTVSVCGTWKFKFDCQKSISCSGLMNWFGQDWPWTH